MRSDAGAQRPDIIELLDVGPLSWRRFMAYTKHRTEAQRTSAHGGTWPRWAATHSLLWAVSHCVVALAFTSVVASAAYLSAVLVPLLAAALLSFALLPLVRLLERYLRLPHALSVPLTLSAVLATGRAVVSGVWQEVAVFVEVDKPRLDAGFTDALQGSMLRLLDPAADAAHAAHAAAAAAASRLACILPGGERIFPWSSQPGGPGNEGCLAPECACAGALYRVSLDGSGDVLVDTYGYDDHAAVGLAEFLLIRARTSIWGPAQEEQAAAGGIMGGAVAVQSLSHWWGEEAPGLLESVGGVIFLASLFLWIDLSAVVLGAQPRRTAAGASAAMSADGQQGQEHEGALEEAAGVIQTYVGVRLGGAVWLGLSTWLIFTICAASGGGGLVVVLPFTLTVLNMVFHFIPVLGGMWWITLAVGPLIGFDSAIGYGEGIALMMLLMVPHVVNHVLWATILWRQCSRRRDASSATAAGAAGAAAEDMHAHAPSRPIAAVVAIVLLGRGLSSALALWLAVPLLMLCKLKLKRIDHPLASFLVAEWL